MNYCGSSPPTLILLFFSTTLSKQLIIKKKMCGVYIYDTLGISAGKLKLFTEFNAAAAAAAKSLQSCPTPCDPIDGSPPGSPVPAFFQARTLEWVAISFSNA